MCIRVVGNIFSLPNYHLNHLSLYYNTLEYMADFKSTFEGDNWVKKLHFKLGDMRVPKSVFWYRDWFVITIFTLCRNATYLKMADFKLKF